MNRKRSCSMKRYWYLYISLFQERTIIRNVLCTVYFICRTRLVCGLFFFLFNKNVNIFSHPLYSALVECIYIDTRGKKSYINFPIKLCKFEGGSEKVEEDGTTTTCYFFAANKKDETIFLHVESGKNNVSSWRK